MRSTHENHQERSALEYERHAPPHSCPFNTTLKHDTKNDIPVKPAASLPALLVALERASSLRRHGAYLIGRLFYLIVWNAPPLLRTGNFNSPLFALHRRIQAQLPFCLYIKHSLISKGNSTVLSARASGHRSQKPISLNVEDFDV